MIEEVNGDSPSEPEPNIKIFWDDKKKQASMQWSPEAFPNYEFLLAVIEVCKQQVESIKRTAQLAQMQSQMQQAQQASALGRRLNLGK